MHYNNYLNCKFIYMKRKRWKIVELWSENVRGMRQGSSQVKVINFHVQSNHCIARQKNAFKLLNVISNKIIMVQFDPGKFTCVTSSSTIIRLSKSILVLKKFSSIILINCSINASRWIFLYGNQKLWYIFLVFRVFCWVNLIWVI